MTESLTTKQDALKLIHARNFFYRKQFYAVLGILILNLIVIAILCFLLKYLFAHKIRPLYFVASSNGRLLAQPALEKPLPQSEVIAWITEAVEAANSFDFVNYRTQLQTAQNYFVDSAWQDYMKALTLSLNLRTVIERKEVWVSQLSQPPLVTREGVVGGAYAWRYDVYVQESRLKPPQYKDIPRYFYKISVVVQRKPLLQSYKGLALLSMIKEPVAATIQQRQKIISSSPS